MLKHFSFSFTFCDIFSLFRVPRSKDLRSKTPRENSLFRIKSQKNPYEITHKNLKVKSLVKYFKSDHRKNPWGKNYVKNLKIEILQRKIP